MSVAGSELGPVLVVDDDPEILNFLSILLELEGIEAKLATSAAQADRLLEKEGAAKLILLDIAMPDRDGLDFCRALKRDARTATIPVFVLSARPGRDVIDRALAAGAAQFIRKPFDNAELVARIVEQLKS
jgi:DNA-binding response OmpR family regulator